MELEGEVGAKRVRKQTEVFQVVSKNATPRKTSIKEGAGIPLADNPHFCKEIERLKADDNLCKALHSLLYGSAGKRHEIKKNIRKFSGLNDEVSKEAMKSKVNDKKKVWTTSLLKSALGLFGLEKGGDRDILVSRMTDYIAKPTFTKDASATKRRRNSSGKNGSGSTKKSKKGTGAPNAYIMYTQAHRAEVSEANPDAAFGDIGKLLAEQWNSLSEEEKEVWRVKAAERKEAMKGVEGNVDENDDDIDFGSDEEEGDGNEVLEEEEEEEEEEAVPTPKGRGRPRGSSGSSKKNREADASDDNKKQQNIAEESTATVDKSNHEDNEEEVVDQMLVAVEEEKVDGGSTVESSQQEEDKQSHSTTTATEMESKEVL